MAWQKVARIIVALVGIGCAAVVYVLLRTPPVDDAAPAVVLLDDTVKAESRDSQGKQVDRDGRVIYERWSGRSRELVDGRLMFDDVKISFPHGATTYTVTADMAESSGVAGPTGEQPSTFVFRKNVRMVGENGFAVATEEATYLGAEQRINFPGAMSFTRGQLSGRGVGGDLYMGRSVLWLYDEAQMTIAPEDGSVGVVATAKRIGLADADHYLRMEEGAELRRDDQLLSGDLIMVFFAEESPAVRRVELDGESSVRQTGGGDRPDMSADEIDLDFDESGSALRHANLKGSPVLTLRDTDGQTRVSGSVIDMTLAPDGQTLTRLDVAGPSQVQLPRTGDTPARTIESDGLIAEGAAPAGLDRAVFRGGVVYRELRPATRGQAASERKATSDSLALELGGALKDVTMARFRQRFTVDDDGTHATADEGRYDAKGETLQLRANVPTRIQPTVVTDEMEVRAQEIDLDLNRDTIEARGQVTSLRKATVEKDEDGPAPAGLFERGKPITAQAERFSYAKASGVALYSDAVTLVQESASANQGSSILQADEVRLDETEQDLSATGHVRSTFYLSKTPAAANATEPSWTRMQGERMTYTNATRVLAYSGLATMLSENGERLSGDLITLELLSQTRGLKRLDATAAAGDVVRAKLSGDRYVSGLTLAYDAEAGRYLVTGIPATFVSKAPAKGKDMCEVGTGSKLEFQRTAGWSNATNEGGAVGRAQDMKCAEVIK